VRGAYPDRISLNSLTGSILVTFGRLVNKRKRGTVTRPPTRDRRTEWRFGNEVRYDMIGSWNASPPACQYSTPVQRPRPYERHRDGSVGELPGVLCARGPPTASHRASFLDAPPTRTCSPAAPRWTPQSASAVGSDDHMVMWTWCALRWYSGGPGLGPAIRRWPPRCLPIAILLWT
jgi:hypothetical protein